MADGEDVRVVDDPAELRYELRVGDVLAGVVRYRREGDVVVLVHTDVDPAFEGRGLGGRLVAGALDDLRARGLKAAPICPFVADYVRRHPEYGDLVVPDPSVSD